ncbi:hypothetical protein ACHAW6_004312, partial [Cyclotella cf. meneghiniana]
DAVLKELEKRSLSTGLTVRNHAPLRTCTTVVSSWDATELVENSGAIRPEEMRELFHKVEEWTSGEKADGRKASAVCIMGSTPPGCDEDTYAQLTKRLAENSSLVLIDSVVGLNPLLETLKEIYGNDKVGSRAGGAVLKLNAAELCKLGNVAKKESDCVTLEELKLSTAHFLSKYVNAKALQYLCVTDGKFPGYLVQVPENEGDDEFRMWKMVTIDLSQQGMLFPIGAGDTVAAGTLAAWQYLHHVNSQYDGVISPVVGGKLVEKERKWSQDKIERGWRMATAFAFGIACGSASCLKEENSVFDIVDAMDFFEGMNEPFLVE